MKFSQIRYFKVTFHLPSKKKCFNLRKWLAFLYNSTPLFIYPRNRSYHLFWRGRRLFKIDFKIMFCWLANDRAVVIERTLQNSDTFYPRTKILRSVCSNPWLSNIAFVRLRRRMLIAFNPYHDLWASWYPFPRAATTVWLFCLLLKLHRHLQSKLWIVVP